MRLASLSSSVRILSVYHPHEIGCCRAELVARGYPARLLERYCPGLPPRPSGLLLYKPIGLPVTCVLPIIKWNTHHDRRWYHRKSPRPENFLWSYVLMSSANERPTSFSFFASLILRSYTSANTKKIRFNVKIKGFFYRHSISSMILILRSRFIPRCTLTNSLR